MIIKVKIDKVEGVDDADLASFVEDALSTWGGQLHPQDPLFNSLNVLEITIRGQKFLYPEESA